MQSEVRGVKGRKERRAAEIRQEILVPGTKARIWVRFAILWELEWSSADMTEAMLQRSGTCGRALSQVTCRYPKSDSMTEDRR